MEYDRDYQECYFDTPNPDRFDENKNSVKIEKKQKSEKEKLNLTDGLHGEELKRKWKNW